MPSEDLFTLSFVLQLARFTSQFAAAYEKKMTMCKVSLSPMHLSVVKLEWVTREFVVK